MNGNNNNENISTSQSHVYMNARKHLYCGFSLSLRTHCIKETGKIRREDTKLPSHSFGECRADAFARPVGSVKPPQPEVKPRAMLCVCVCVCVGIQSHYVLACH